MSEIEQLRARLERRDLADAVIDMLADSVINGYPLPDVTTRWGVESLQADIEMEGETHLIEGRLETYKKVGLEVRLVAYRKVG